MKGKFCGFCTMKKIIHQTTVAITSNRLVPCKLHIQDREEGPETYLDHLTMTKFDHSQDFIIEICVYPGKGVGLVDGASSDTLHKWFTCFLSLTDRHPQAIVYDPLDGKEKFTCILANSTFTKFAIDLISQFSLRFAVNQFLLRNRLVIYRTPLVRYKSIGYTTLANHLAHKAGMISHPYIIHCIR